MNEKEFINAWVDKIRTQLLKKFPDDFIKEYDCKDFPMPNKYLILGAEIFGSFELIDTQGNILFQTDNYSKAKYIFYSNVGQITNIKLPLDEADISKAVSNYEKYLDAVLEQIKHEYNQAFPGSKSFPHIYNSIFKSQNLQRY